jgi:hypothetical protein
MEQFSVCGRVSKKALLFHYKNRTPIRLSIGKEKKPSYCITVFAEYAKDFFPNTLHIYGMVCAIERLFKNGNGIISFDENDLVEIVYDFDSGEGSVQFLRRHTLLMPKTFFIRAELVHDPLDWQKICNFGKNPYRFQEEAV